MSVGTNFNVGKDVQLVLIAPNGQRVDLTNITDFDAKPQYKTARSDLLNNPPIERYLPAGHMISFSIDRRDGTNDRLFSQIEQNWWANGSADLGTSNQGQAFAYITETNGTQTTWQFTGVALKLTNRGDVKTDSPIKQKIEGFASTGQVI
jgi:hypothetical protein